MEEPVVSTVDQTPQENATLPQSPPRKTALIATVVFGIVLLIGVAAYAGIQYGKQTKDDTSTVVTATPTGTATPTATPAADPLLTGKLSVINDDLGLIVNTTDRPSSLVTYYEAGTYAKGAYKGYKRILAVRTAMGLGFSSDIFTFATKDNKSYVLDGNPKNATDFSEKSERNPYYAVTKAKISSIDSLPSDHASDFAIDSAIGATKNTVFTTEKDSGTKDESGYPVSQSVLATDFSAYTKLKSPNTSLTLYQQNSPIDSKYVAGTTEIIAVDSTGLAFKYDLGTSKSVTTYKTEQAAYDAAERAYEIKLDKGQTATSPSLSVTYPSFRLESSEVSGLTGSYKTYSIAFPGSCAIGGNTSVTTGLTDKDLKKVGTYNGGDIYAIKASTHPLLVLQYETKIKNLDEETFKSVNNTSAEKPSFEAYVAKNPLLFEKDYWGRYIALGEFDYQINGGCGKPVVYLYPTTPTKVSLSFASPMKLSVAIPNYNNGWNVLAQPNGQLTDLQPEATNCSSIDTARKGSEYAAQACATHTYPYLYWAGTSLQTTYPKVDGGWVVAKADLSSFMNKTLDSVGLTQKEKSDMLEYWLPEMQAKNSPYYKISFLQTPQMNQVAPMNVSPTPDSVFRIFLDYTPLQSNQGMSLKPQTLGKVVRKGFTVVEWGGLKK